jgi:hypothetical protein
MTIFGSVQARKVITFSTVAVVLSYLLLIQQLKATLKQLLYRKKKRKINNLCTKTENLHFLLLTNPVSPILRLQINLWIPR